jgi:hypothetical protein
MLPPDSQAKTQETKKLNNSLKEILEKNSSNKESQSNPDNVSTTDIEKEILKQIK